MLIIYMFMDKNHGMLDVEETSLIIDTYSFIFTF